MNPIGLNLELEIWFNFPIIIGINFLKGTVPKHIYFCNETLLRYKIILLVLLDVLRQWIMLLNDAYIQCICALSFILGQQRESCSCGYLLTRNTFKCLVLWSVTLSQGPPTLHRESLCDLYIGKLSWSSLWLTVTWLLCIYSLTLYQWFSVG